MVTAERSPLYNSFQRTGSSFHSLFLNQRRLLIQYKWLPCRSTKRVGQAMVTIWGRQKVVESNEQAGA